MDVLVTRVEQRRDATLASALRAMIAGMDDPLVDLPAAIDALTRGLTVRIPSSLGFTITVQTGLRAVRVTTAAPVVADIAEACLLLLLSPNSEPGSSAVFYAADPGALDSLAASSEWRSSAYDPVILDSHLQRV